MSDDNPISGGKEDARLSSPFSTGGGGTRFEFQVQAAFATLMLAGGFAPCLPCLPIKSIKQQAHHADYRTDDLVIIVSNPSGSETRRLLVQVKHGISFTKTDTQFIKTIADAWRDFNDTAIFTRGKDAIAIISGPLSATDVEDTRRILEWARDQESAQEFFQNVGKANFSSDKKRDKLAAFRAHIDAAAGKTVSDDEVFEFLRHLHVLSYDLDVRAGMMHALLHSIVGRYSPENPASLYSRVFEHVSSSNQNAGTLTVESFPDEIREAFRPPVIEVMPASLASTVPPPAQVDWNASEFAEALAVANLVGGWNENSPADMAIVAALTPDKPSEFLRKMREVVQRPESPLLHLNGVWTVRNRVAMWASLAPRVFNETLSKFRECAMKVLGECNPAFELDLDKRFAAQIYGKVLSHSAALRAGIADTLALMGTSTVRLPNCAMKAGEDAATIVMRDLFTDADWQLWGSLDLLLPTLGEAAPRAFLDAVEAALQKHPCPFDSLFAQEGNAFAGGNYITGLLWALETLAWDKTYLVRVAVILGMLAARDPGGNWGNRPANSLGTIFLPWFPQTRASIGKREVAVKAVVRERREVGWRLLLRLLPSHHGTSMGSRKPKWRNRLASDDVPRPTDQDYWAQIAIYAQMAVDVVRSDSDKLGELIDSLDKLPEPALNEVLEFAKTDAVTGLPDERRLPIWSKLSAFVRLHRQHAEAEWALSAGAVDKIDQVAALLAPQDPSVADRILFRMNTWDLYDDPKDWRNGQVRVAERQRDAVQEIYSRGGIASLMAFAEKVESPSQAGFALGKLESIHVDADLLPSEILSPEPKRRELVRGYVSAMFHRSQWSWFDELDTAAWSNHDIAQVLTYLPFDAEAWKRANERLPEDGKEYWTRVPVHGFMATGSDYVAVDALMRHGRPRAAVACLATQADDKNAIDPVRAIEALLGAVQSSEPRSSIDQHGAALVIKALQDEGHADKKGLIAVEWAYLQVLEHSHVTGATTLGAALASEPDLFCDVIRTIFRSEKEEENQQRPELTEERQAIAQNAYHLLETWVTVPGMDASGDVSGEQLRSWIGAVKASLEQSGHLTVGLHKAGEVLIHAPADPSGLFMHRAVAEVLNREDMDELRRGYESAVHNSRGAHFVDPTGAPEKELARVYNEKADAVENAGYHRLAVTLRSISESYKREAERNIVIHEAERRMQDAE